MKYSLSDYIVSIQPNDAGIKRIFGNIVIGGEGDATDSIIARLANDLWSTTGFATGAWVHNKNLDRHGTVELSVSQLSEKVAKLKQFCNLYYGGEYSGATITISDIYGIKVCTCVDCYVTKIPDQQYSSTAGNQTWQFTCGEISFQ